MKGTQLGLLSEALSSLPAGDRVLLALTRVEGLALGEIAEVLGRPAEEIAHELARAEARLDRFLSRHPGPPPERAAQRA